MKTRRSIRTGRPQSIKVFLLLLAVVCTLSQIARADGPVWRISREGRHFFLGGTIHLLTPSDYPLPLAFDKAYRQTTRLVFETDIERVKSLEFQMRMLSELLLGEGQNLQAVISAETFQALQNHLAERGIPAAGLVQFKPGMAAMMLTMIELQRLNLMGTGVDEFYHARAVKDQKEVGHLESADEQLAFISNLGKGQEDQLIAYTLRDLSKLPDYVQKLKTAWRQGDRRELAEISTLYLKKDFPGMYDELIVQRNRAWVPLLEAMIETPEVEFVLVGAAHLVGQEGLLAQLGAKGYDIHKE